jgi:hypothetical protein
VLVINTVGRRSLPTKEMGSLLTCSNSTSSQPKISMFHCDFMDASPLLQVDMSMLPISTMAEQSLLQSQ